MGLGRELGGSCGISVLGDLQTLAGHIPEEPFPPGSAPNLPHSHPTCRALCPSTTRPWKILLLPCIPPPEADPLPSAQRDNSQHDPPQGAFLPCFLLISSVYLSTPRVTDGPAPNCSKIMGLKLEFQVLHLGICFSNMELGTSEMWNFQKFGNFRTGSSRAIMKLFEVVLFDFFCHFRPFRVTLRPLLLLTPLAPWLPQAMAPTMRSCCPTPPSWPG